MSLQGAGHHSWRWGHHVERQGVAWGLWSRGACAGLGCGVTAPRPCPSPCAAARGAHFLCLSFLLCFSLKFWSLRGGSHKSYVNNQIYCQTFMLPSAHSPQPPNSLCHQEFLTRALASLGVQFSVCPTLGGCGPASPPWKAWLLWANCPERVFPVPAAPQAPMWPTGTSSGFAF